MFHSLPHYMKLYDVLKGAYSNYKAGWSLLVKRKLKSRVVCWVDLIRILFNWKHMVQKKSIPHQDKYYTLIQYYIQITRSFPTLLISYISLNDFEIQFSVDTSHLVIFWALTMWHLWHLRVIKLNHKFKFCIFTCKEQ